MRSSLDTAADIFALEAHAASLTRQCDWKLQNKAHALKTGLDVELFPSAILARERGYGPIGKGIPSRTRVWALTLRNGLSEETRMMRNKRLDWEGVPRWREGGEVKPGELLCNIAHSLRFYAGGISFRAVSGQSPYLAHI